MKKEGNIKQKFSFFKSPVTNVTPYRDITLLDAHRVITGKYYKRQTLKLRLLSDKQENRRFKATHFPYCTFSGTFTRRNEDSLILHSGLISLDFDHMKDIQTLKLQLLKDPYFQTELLFVSPNGAGLKWIVSIDVTGKYSHADWFQAIYNYIRETYNIEIDKSCRDVARASFLSHDKEAFIHPKYLVQ
ncbi:MAG: hypothetical protein K0B11_16470 [Mariniphaga sp.]|nr:hypothetical protein [Mariniphaga sp.]